MMQNLTYTSEVAQSTTPIYEILKDQFEEEYWETIAPYIHEINRLKREKNAVILAHNYMTPDIFHGVADIVGDSLALAREAAKSEADIIVQCGVHFMAETSKALCMDKKVLIPDMNAGCSLAESIPADDVRLLREKHPGVPIITYVNTSAEVKAESDICCTSGNAIKIVNAMESDTVMMIPDKYLADYVRGHTDKKVLTWEGSCEVHEKFTPEDIIGFRERYEGVQVIAHPECPPEVLAEADFTGSTQDMVNYIEGEKPSRVVLITECSMGDNIAAAHPEIEMVKSCQMCPHMKRITLPKILECLQNESPEVLLPAEIAERSRVPIQKMLDIK